MQQKKFATPAVVNNVKMSERAAYGLAWKIKAYFCFWFTFAFVSFGDLDTILDGDQELTMKLRVQYDRWAFFLQVLVWPDGKHLLAADANGSPVRPVGNGQLSCCPSATSSGFIVWKWLMSPTYSLANVN